jgi:transcriptional regulator with GAF, ATPase, and Fis domain
MRSGALPVPLLSLVLGPNRDVDVVAGPLAGGEHGASGVLMLLEEAGSFSNRLVAEAQRLLEPFAVAVASSQRVQELGRLREVVEADNRALLSRLDRQQIVDSIVGADAGFRQVMAKVGQVAPTDAPVLLLGETGTGKEVVARAIHDQSRRRGGPMLRVNCGAVPPGLIDSELFGHERGSFTGAVSARAGWFERADGGTLFLDEIGELSLAAQVRLLRVLQESVLERVGGHRTIRVDVRVITATHRDLEDMVREGRFREDLWYRISVFPIPLPPLRTRREDIPALAAHFAWRAGKRIGGAPLVPSPADVDLLLDYDWPGNVRELAAVVERAAILGDGRQLDVAGALGAQSERGRRAESPSQSPPRGPFPSLDEIVAQHIEAALSRTRGRIEGPAGAGALLRVNPHTLRSRMRKLGLDWRRFRA